MTRISSLPIASPSEVAEGIWIPFNNAGNNKTLRAQLSVIRQQVLGDIYFVKRTLTVAEILDLYTTKAGILAAPGLGYAWDVLKATYRVNYGTTPFATTPELQIISDGVSALPQFEDAKAFLADASVIRKMSRVQVTGTSDNQLVENAALMAFAPAANPTAGDSTYDLYIMAQKLIL